MKFLQYGLAALLILSLFAFSVRSITAVRLEELRFRIQKEQIMKYELSSRALREKLKNIFLEKDNLRSEIQAYVLESDSMNGDWGDEGRNFWESSGYVISRVAGIFHFKTPQPLYLERDTLKQLQLAFYYEKKRNFSEAEKSYKTLVRKLHPLSEEMGFVLLHRGFCQSMIGMRQEAKKILKQIIREFPATHYSDNANLLLGLIEKSERKRIAYRELVKTDSEMIDFYYKNGDYPEIIQLLSGKSDLSYAHQYILSRSREETGQITDAVRGYIELVKQTQDLDVARLSNRRLLVLGNFVLKNESLREFSEQNARRIGDIESLALVEEGRSRLKQEVLEKEFLNKDKNTDTVLRELISNIPVALHSDRASIPTSNSRSSGEIALELSLQDGRVFYFSAIGRSEDRAVIEKKDFNITIPLASLSGIRARGSSAKDPIHVELENETINGERIDFLDYEISLLSADAPKPRKFNWREVKRISLRKF